jgi:SAM-dependent methyltransferase
MSHPSQLEFVGITKSLFADMFVGRKVLEIGSLDINGSVRGLFEKCDYTGLDIAPGPGVDEVCEGQKYAGESASFDVVVSCEVMEHNPYWEDTFKNMIRLLKPGGLMVMSCATGGRMEHGTTRSDPSSSPLTIGKGWEYYRNLSAKDIVGKVDFSTLSSWAFVTNFDAWDLYFLGVKAGCGPDAIEGIAKFRAIYRRRGFFAWCRRAGRVAQNPLRVLKFLKRKIVERDVARHYTADGGGR